MKISHAVTTVLLYYAYTELYLVHRGIYAVGDLSREIAPCTWRSLAWCGYDVVQNWVHCFSCTCSVVQRFFVLFSLCTESESRDNAESLAVEPR